METSSQTPDKLEITSAAGRNYIAITKDGRQWLALAPTAMLTDEEHFAIMRRCVKAYNATAGMADPAAEIQAMREAIKEADQALADLVEHIGQCSEHDLLECDADPHPPSVFSVYAAQAKYAISKLQPFIQ